MTIETIGYSNVRLEIEAGLATIILDNPSRLNALSHDMAMGIVTALQEIAKPRRAIRCLMITGEGRGFCAGANMSARSQSAGEGEQAPRPQNLAALGGVETLFHPLARRLRDVQVPVVAAVNGPCAGFGVVMALLADYVIVSDEAFFLVPFRDLASCTDSGLTWLLPRAVGPARARQMVMRAERVYAADAVSWGLANKAVPMAEFRGAAREVADNFASGPTVALSLMRRLIMDADSRGFDEHLEAELKGVAVTSRTKDNVAAIKVFGSKNKPQFVGS